MRCAKNIAGLIFIVFIATAALFFKLTVSAYSHAESTPFDEYQVKAAFLYNFTKFVEWPAGALGAKISICTLGDDQFGGYLDLLNGKVVDGRPLVVRRNVDLESANSCHVLFVCPGGYRVSDVLQKTGNHPVLTVGETKSFTAAGGIISFVVRENRVQFEINADAARRAGLKISSQLMKLARPRESR